MKTSIAFVILAGISHYFTGAMGEENNGMVLMVGVDKDTLEETCNYITNNIMSPILRNRGVIPNMKELTEFFSDEQKVEELKMKILDTAENILQELGEKVKMLRAGDADPNYRSFISMLQDRLKALSQFFETYVVSSFQEMRQMLDQMTKALGGMN